MIPRFNTPLQLLGPAAVAKNATVGAILNATKGSAIAPVTTGALRLNAIRFHGISVFSKLTKVSVIRNAPKGSAIGRINAKTVRFDNVHFGGVRKFSNKTKVGAIVNSNLAGAITDLKTGTVNLGKIRFDGVGSFDNSTNHCAILNAANSSAITIPAPNALRIGGIKFDTIAKFSNQKKTGALLNAPTSSLIITANPGTLTFGNLDFVGIDTFRKNKNVGAILNDDFNGTAISLLTRPGTLALGGATFHDIDVFSKNLNDCALLNATNSSRFTLDDNGDLRFNKLAFHRVITLSNNNKFGALINAPNGSDFILLDPGNKFVVVNNTLPKFSGVGTVGALANRSSLSLIKIPLSVPIRDNNGLFIGSDFLNHSTKLGVALGTSLAMTNGLAVLPVNNPVARANKQVITNNAAHLRASDAVALLNSGSFGILAVAKNRDLSLISVGSLILNRVFFAGKLGVSIRNGLATAHSLVRNTAPPPFPALSDLDDDLTAADNLTAATPAKMALDDKKTVAATSVEMPNNPVALITKKPLAANGLSADNTGNKTMSLASNSHVRIGAVGTRNRSANNDVATASTDAFQTLKDFLSRGNITTDLSAINNDRNNPVALACAADLFALNSTALGNARKTVADNSITLLPNSFIFNDQIFNDNLPKRITFVTPNRAPPPPPPPSSIGRIQISSARIVLTSSSRTKTVTRRPILLAGAKQSLRRDRFDGVRTSVTDRFDDCFNNAFHTPHPIDLTTTRGALHSVRTRAKRIPTLMCIHFGHRTFHISKLNTLRLLLIPPGNSPVQIRILSTGPRTIVRTRRLLHHRLAGPGLASGATCLTPTRRLCS